MKSIASWVLIVACEVSSGQKKSLCQWGGTNSL